MKEVTFHSAQETASKSVRFSDEGHFARPHLSIQGSNTHSSRFKCANGRAEGPSAGLQPPRLALVGEAPRSPDSFRGEGCIPPQENRGEDRGARPSTPRCVEPAPVSKRAPGRPVLIRLLGHLSPSDMTSPSPLQAPASLKWRWGFGWISADLSSMCSAPS